MRGNVDLVINATFWIGAAFGAGGTLLLLNSGLVSPTFGWRFAFGIGAALGLIILVLRKSVPESPRWLMLRGREQEAESIVGGIENDVSRQKGELKEPQGGLKIAVRDHTPLRDVWNATLPAAIEFSLEPAAPGIYHPPMRVPGSQPLDPKIYVMP